MKKVFILSFILLSFIIYFLFNNFQNNITNKELEKITEKYVKAYDTIYEEKKRFTQVIVSGIISLGKIESRLSQLKNSTLEEKNRIREEIYNDLKKRYERLVKLGIRQVHIHLPNNESFLRMNQPTIFGDNLTGIRKTVEYVSKYKMPIDSPEEGRIYYGYRFVYPIFKDENYVGSIEISFRASDITSAMMNQYDVLSNFFFKSSISKKRNFKDTKSVYKPSHHEGYNYDLEVLKDLKKVSNKDMNQLKPDKECTLKIRELAQKDKPSSIYNKKIDAVFTIIPIFNKLTSENIAFLTVRSKPDNILLLSKYNNINLTLIISLLALILLIIYILISQKKVLESKIKNKTNELDNLNSSLQDLVLNQTNKLLIQNEKINKERKKFKSLLKNATDGIHITTLDANIIDCSDSFALMLGYSKEEILKLNANDWSIAFEKDKEHLKHILENKESRFETKFKRKDNSIIDVDVLVKVINIDGTEHLYASARDISLQKTFEKQLITEREKFEHILESATDGIHILDENGNLITCSNSFAKMLAYEKDELLKLNVKDWDMGFTSEKELFGAVKDLIINSATFETKHKRKDETIIDVQITAKGLKLDGKMFLYASSRDITLVKNQERKLNELNKTLEKFIDTQENIVVVTTKDELKFVNNRFLEFFGVKSIDEFENHFNHKLIAELFVRNDRFFHLGNLDNKKKWIDSLTSLPKSKQLVSLVDKKFKAFAFSLSINEFDDDSTIISFADISENMLEQIDLEEKVIHDKLTNAYNREYFEQNYKKFVSSFNSLNNKLALALLDIDHFKNVNDTYGHDIGDEILKEFVNVIKRYSRKDDILVRWGGEEFVLVLKVNSKVDLENALEHIRKVVEINNFTKVEKITCSIGATIYKENENIEETIKRADIAVYEAKANGRNQVIFNT